MQDIVHLITFRIDFNTCYDPLACWQFKSVFICYIRSLFDYRKCSSCYFVAVVVAVVVLLLLLLLLFLLKVLFGCWVFIAITKDMIVVMFGLCRVHTFSI